jgi:SAM-dependent methyltransferase
MKDWFVNWFDSPYYHLLYKNRNDDEALQFVGNIVKHLGLKANQTLLDLACGKGRHACAFSKLGLDVTGIDLSKNSIAFAKQFEKDHLHFYEHDMRLTFRTNYYDVVCNLFTSFGYFQTSHDNELAANAMYHATKKGGHILIDFVNRQHAIRNIENKKLEYLTVDSVNFTLKRNYNDKEFLKHIEIDDLGKKLEFNERLSSFTLDEMITIFEKSGCQFQSAHGSYEFEHYDQMLSPRMIVIFKK